jgi:hypothetical protein
MSDPLWRGSRLRWLVDIELFSQQRLSFLRHYQAFAHGVPSDDTLRRFFRAVDPEQFQTLFIQWMHDVVGADQARQSPLMAKRRGAVQMAHKMPCTWSVPMPVKPIWCLASRRLIQNPMK